MRFLNTQLGYYAASLLLANLIISVGGIMNFPFLLQARIIEGAISLKICYSVSHFSQEHSVQLKVHLSVHLANHPIYVSRSLVDATRKRRDRLLYSSDRHTHNVLVGL
jgi:hypothetical protein